MRPSDGTPKPSSRKRWVVGLAIVVIVILIGAIEARRRWSPPRSTDECATGPTHGGVD